MIVKTKMPVVFNNTGAFSSYDGEGVSYAFGDGLKSILGLDSTSVKAPMTDQQKQANTDNFNSLLSKGVSIADAVAQFKAAGKTVPPTTQMQAIPTSENKQSGKKSEGMSTTTKVVIAVSIVGTIALIIYGVKKMKHVRK